MNEAHRATTAALHEVIETAALEALQSLEQHLAMNRARLMTYEQVRRAQPKNGTGKGSGSEEHGDESAAVEQQPPTQPALTSSLDLASHDTGQEVVASTRRCHQRGTGGVAESGIHEKSRGQEFGRGGRTSPTLQSAGLRGPSSSPFRPGIGTIGGAVTVGARFFGNSIEEPKFHEIGGGSPCAEFRGSRATRVGTIRQTASSWRRHSDKPAGSRMLDGLQAIGISRCSRDGRHWVVPVDLQGCAPDGVFPCHGFQHGLLKQVPPLHRALWGWRGVRVGEASNPGPVQTRSARRLAEPLQDTVQDSVRVDVSTSRRRRRRLRALLWSWDSDSDLAEPVQTQVRRSQRSFGRRGSCPLQPWQACGPQDRWRIVCDGSCKSRSFLRSRILARGRKSEDVVDALESDLVVEDSDGPVEVFAMTDAVPEEFEGRLVMGRRVVLVPQSADGTPRSHFNVSNSTRCPHCQQLGSRLPNLCWGKLQFNL